MGGRGGWEESRCGVEEETEGGGERRGEEDLEASSFNSRLDFVISALYLNLHAINSDAICKGLWCCPKILQSIKLVPKIDSFEVDQNMLPSLPDDLSSIPFLSIGHDDFFQSLLTWQNSSQKFWVF